MSTRDITIRVSSVVCLPTDSGGEAIDVLFRLTSIFDRKVIIGTEVFGSLIKSIKAEHRRFIPGIGRPVAILAAFTDTATAHIGPIHSDKDER